MKNVIIIERQEYAELAEKVTDYIIKQSSAGYAYKLISRETGEELEELAARGFIGTCVRNVLKLENYIGRGSC